MKKHLKGLCFYIGVRLFIYHRTNCWEYATRRGSDVGMRVIKSNL